MLGHIEDLPRIAVASIRILVVAIPFIVLANIVRRLFSRASLPPSLPWVGTGLHSGPLSRARANLKSFFGLKTLLDEGYYKYSRNNKAYVLPYFLNGCQVVLPLSQLDWLLAQPDSVLSQEDVNRHFVKDPVHPEIIRHELTKKLNSFADDVVGEMEQALADIWGANAADADENGWVEMNVYQTLLHIVARLSTRVFVGLPLCRDAEFLEACQSFNRNVALSGAFLNLLPGFLKPVLAPLVSSADYLRYKKCAKYILPTIKERLQILKNREKLPVFDPSPPSDYIQWAIDHAVNKEGLESRELESRVIATRFAILCFAAIQSSVITLTNAVFDIASSPDCASSLDTMRDEVLRETATASATPAASPTWSRAMMARLTHVDSALRESLRLNGFIERGVMKMVVAPGGVTLPDGSHIPQGTKVGISGWSVHHDNDIYADATTYDAFRFAKGPDSSGSGNNKPQALINTSDHFMGFSHGSHACPGRFFAANQMKIALGHIALRYEIEPIPERPKNRWFLGILRLRLGRR
ncbi:hypothetical protein PG991_001850 [Apiospora marii]|uniref:Cytochrome P450 n=1 Tax=Apiospora marii TaxID=335849 RepID=A0ABR1SN66_9PEZI